MNCQQTREALSARMDGEAIEHHEVDVSHHLIGCAPCRAWQQSAHEVTRRMRVTEAAVTPDRTEELLAALLADAGSARPRRRRITARAVLVGAGLAQLALCIPALVMGHLHHGPVHLAHELGAFDIALAVGFLAAAAAPFRARGMLAMAGPAALALLITAVVDLRAGRTDLLDEAPHLLAVVGWLALWVLARTPHQPAPPNRARIAGAGLTAWVRRRRSDAPGWDLRSSDALPPGQVLATARPDPDGSGAGRARGGQ